MKSPTRETELFPPVRVLFEIAGYEVKGEVNGCDLLAVKDDHCIAVELKLRFNATLLVQATERLKISPTVYLALPRSALGKGRRRPAGIKRVIRMLGLGLIAVHGDVNSLTAEIVFDPGPYQPRKFKREASKVLAEFRQRTGQQNVGGSTRQPLMTAYREQAIQIAVLINAKGHCTVKKLRALGASAKTSSILNKNFYGWFRRVERGVYGLSQSGMRALEHYSEQAAYFAERLLNNEKH